MRRNIINSARSATPALRNDVSRTLQRPAFICTSCRRAALDASKTTAHPNQRHFSSSTPLSQQPPTPEASHRQESITPQTHYDFFPNTFPNGPPPHSPFTPDLRQLRNEFLQLQAKTHPDRAAAGQKRQAEALSMRLNEAYKAIQDPLKRARYLLSIRGIDVEDESAKTAENQLLMEVMEAREAVEEVENEEQLAEIRAENNLRMSQSTAILEEAFANDDLERAAEEAIRLRYWANIEESIHGWEKGKGGGIIHH